MTTIASSPAAFDPLQLPSLKERLARTEANQAQRPKPSRAAAIHELQARITAEERLVARLDPAVVAQARELEWADYRAAVAHESAREAEKAEEARRLYAAWSGAAKLRQLTDLCRSDGCMVDWAIKPAAWHLVCHLLRKAGGRREHRSEGSAYYRFPGGQRLRISDHALPTTDERSYNHDQGWRSHSLGCEVVLSGPLTPQEVEALVDEALGDEALSDDADD